MVNLSIPNAQTYLIAIVVVYPTISPLFQVK